MNGSSLVQERDACAIIALVNKRGESTHANIVQTVDALRKMGHRSGDIDGEGDGCGITIDIPRELWARRLAVRQLSGHLAESRGFFVGHLLIPKGLKPEAVAIRSRVREIMAARGADLLTEATDSARDGELGPRARANAPLFWQLAGLVPDHDRVAGGRRLFHLICDLEEAFPDLHVASLSLDAAVYKLQGLPDLLPRVFPELLDQEVRSVMSLGHGRYSTNTLPTVERSQPFAILGHNGEINTIERLIRVGRTLGIRPVPGGSDSQALDRIIAGLIHLHGLDLLEAMSVVFPAIHSEVAGFDSERQDLFAFYRWLFPASAQGPAAVVARHGDTCLGSVDALGLRPLWLGESDTDCFLSSEKGVVDLDRTMVDPKPLAPGEKVAILAGRGQPAQILDCGQIQRQLARLLALRPAVKKSLAALRRLRQAPDAPLPEAPAPDLLPPVPRITDLAAASNLLAAFGWQQYDLAIRERVSLDGREVIGSMGHTGPLAVFVPENLPNLADACKENVAVVTNPAIDREREAEHFTTRVTLGCRPELAPAGEHAPLGLELGNPLLLDAASLAGRIDLAGCRALAAEIGTLTVEDVAAFFSGNGRDRSRVQVLAAVFAAETGLAPALATLGQEACRAVAAGADLVVLDDTTSFSGDRVFIDPALAVASVVEALTAADLRRRASLVVRSGAIRNLHDIMLLLGLGADALCPYLLWQAAACYASPELGVSRVLANNLSVLQKGMEKVMSTMGIHELCGYGRIFAAIGLAPEVAAILDIPCFCPSPAAGFSLERLAALARQRLARASAPEPLPLAGEPAKNPRVGRVLRDVAIGKTGYLEMARELERLETEMPSGLRHCLALKEVPAEARPALAATDISIGRHSMPLVIAAMSFGSQGENSFRAYAEAAVKANIVCLNGEGGEIPDMLGRYRHNRGQQIASGRFGVSMPFLNSADFLEIKIGQGAKPGEGGHLPGAKVSAMVAEARHCKPGITLISPSNHHDIYSIEDLAQIVTELKTANPEARVSVKIPVTSGVGTIAVGVAKAGADIINLSGFEGGTGAARQHAKRFVGLPVEIGVSEAHRALTESGLRPAVEIWADGGVRSGHDVMKLICLGANRVGIGTAALMAIGCISCQRCHLDRCPRGIATQIRSKADAEAKGVKGFSPRVVEAEAENLARLLGALGEELRMRLAATGVRRLQDLVGRTDLLVQKHLADRVDCAALLAPAPPAPVTEEPGRRRVLRRPLSHLTRLIANLAMERFEQGETEVLYADEGVKSTD
ncbi:MAG: glutamate synthase-related protein, partial [Thermodesulfobacteriota bacterium]